MVRKKDALEASLAGPVTLHYKCRLDWSIMLDMDIPSMHLGNRTFSLAIIRGLVFSVVGIVSLAAIARAEPASPQPGRWLLDYGLGFAGSLQQPTVRDAEFTLIWLKAAEKVSPELEEAYLWQFDLLSRLGQHDEALEALTAYCRVNPHDVSASLNRVSLIVEKAQTTEDRIAACESLLAESPASVEVASDLHRRIAELRFAQGDKARAVENVSRALAIYPQNLAAHALRARIDGREDEPAVAVELLLRELALRPTSADVMGRLAEALARDGSSEAAVEWFHAALDACRSNASVCDPYAIRLALARTYLDSGRFDECVSECSAILADRPDEFEARLLRIEALRRLGRQEEVDRLVEEMSAQFAEQERAVIDRRDARVCAWIAWFHIDVQPVPERAIRFARMANEFAPRTPKLLRVLGWAHLAMDHFDEAKEVLAPLAESDPWAAVGLARARQNSGDPDAAADAIRVAQKLRPVGIVRDRMQETAGKLNLSLNRPSPDAAVAAALSGFDRRILDVARNPAAAVEINVNLNTNSVQVGESIAATISLTNRGPVTLSLGEGGVVDPQVAVSVRDTALKGERLDAYLLIPLHGRFSLEPGESVTVTRNLAVGPARRLLRRQAQRQFDLQFSFVLSPDFGLRDRVASTLSGVAPVTRIVIRRAVDASDKGLEQIQQTLRSGSEAERMRMVLTVIALLEERRAALTQRATYPAIRLNEEELIGLLLEGLSDSTALVRARALFAYLNVSPTQEMIAAAAPLISDENWLARIAAVEVLSRLQRTAFLPVLKDLTSDSNPLVSQLAEMHRQRLRPTGDSQPR